MDAQSLLGELTRLASNYRWVWKPSTADLLSSLPGASRERHPAAVVADLDWDSLERLLGDDQFVAKVGEELEELDRLMALRTDPVIAYCSPEFGLASQVHQYSGGLGILAGDHLKASSDLGVPLTGVGLFYRQGVFRQVIEGVDQQDVYFSATPEQAGAIDTGAVVSVPLPGRDVFARVWRFDVGATPLIVLDTDVEPNTEDDRSITDRLYLGSTEHRIDQEMVLGVGGARALAALGWEIRAHHLNEGHAGFLALEMIDRIIRGSDLARAIHEIRPGIIFTTHTPVPAGIDRFHGDTIAPYLEVWAQRWGIPVSDLWRIGEDPDDHAQFNMAAWCLRLSGAANGVSELHGEVSRGMFAGIGVGDRIISVTNGIHARTWTARHVQKVFDSRLGPGWSLGEQASWDRASSIDDTEIAALRRLGKTHLAAIVAERSGRFLDPDVLTFGFARRFAPYKRANLMLRETERLEVLLADEARPIHIIYSGKAHPYDGHGKAILADVLRYSRSSGARGRVTFLPDYDIEVGLALVQGSDVWLNNPVRPREASGTSGEKVVLNGGLNCSILDGWWAEMYDGHNGWAVESSHEEDEYLRDVSEAASLLDLMQEIVTEYYGDRPSYYSRIRHAWRTLGPRVLAARMVREYRERLYEPAMYGRTRDS